MGENVASKSMAKQTSDDMRVTELDGTDTKVTPVKSMANQTSDDMRVTELDGTDQAWPNPDSGRRTNPNESWRIWAKNERIRIRANLGETGQKTGEFGRIWAKNGRKWAKMGKKRANETETWQNRAKPKVSPKLYSVSVIPGQGRSEKIQT